MRNLPGNGICTLRAAIQEAGAETRANTIVVPAGTYLLSATPACTYKFTGDPFPITENMSALCVHGTVAIIGAGPGSTIIDAGGSQPPACCPSVRAMVISSDATATLSGVTMEHGNLGASQTLFGGAAINNQGTLTLFNSAISFNQASVEGGGGIFNGGTLNMDTTSITNNSAAYGGGLWNSGTAVVTNSTFGNNSTSSHGGGGGIYNALVNGTARLEISTSTINGNNTSGTSGGGIFNDGNSIVTMTNVTVSGNTGSAGGGIFNNSNNSPNSIIANNVTIAFNHASLSGGGVSGELTLGNTIIARNVADFYPYPDCAGLALVSHGHNLIQNTNGCSFTGATATDIYGQDPLLGLLAPNGGLTQTHGLSAGSPAPGVGDPSTPGSGGTACAAGDQRGILRPQTGRCDVGAFERVAGLSITGVSPPLAGNAGSAMLVAFGSGFQPGATLKLRRAGQPDIAAGPTTVNGGNASMAASIVLTGAALGQWDVVVTNPDNTIVTLTGSFSVARRVRPRFGRKLSAPTRYAPALWVHTSLPTGTSEMSRRTPFP